MKWFTFESSYDLPNEAKESQIKKDVEKKIKELNKELQEKYKSKHVRVEMRFGGER